MQIRTLQREQWIPRSLAEVFDFFREACNLNRITPSWLHFKVLRQTRAEIRAGTLIHYRLAWHGIPVDWTSRIEEWQPPFRFVDLQLKGPYRLWRHIHSFEALGGGTLVSDSVHYAVPFGILGDLCTGWLVREEVEQIFDYRAQAIAAIFGEQPVSAELGQRVYR